MTTTAFSDGTNHIVTVWLQSSDTYLTGTFSLDDFVTLQLSLADIDKTSPTADEDNGPRLKKFFQEHTIEGKELTAHKLEIDEATRKIKDWNKVLTDFCVKYPVYSVLNDNLIYKGIKIAVPADLTEQLLEGTEEEVSAYTNFWANLLLNPTPAVRLNIFKWCKNNGIKITPDGYLVAYRAANLTKKGSFPFLRRTLYALNNKLSKGANLEGLRVMEDGSIFEGLEGGVGLLENYYKIVSLPLNDETARTYTDAHTGTFTYQIGKVAQESSLVVDRVQSNTCSKGLHLGSKDFAFSGFGNTMLGCLVDPKDICAVPIDGYHKIRTTQFYPFTEFKNMEMLKAFNDDEVDVFTIPFTDKLFNQAQGLNIEEFEYVNMFMQGLDYSVKRYQQVLDELNITLPNEQDTTVSFEDKLQLVTDRFKKL